ncbi:CpsB/CapC family capsule biosynthesis tyrosine phosphatase [Ruminococcus sp.]|uniref:CpsB/CapC family capsule biosynthesis tyrosine phosphatase n=1 Tax=Ruminococcus sp. TaxID=41978 RepID=UPI0025CBD96A|nr:CpsB/CapC family capsule biosynthesis tyrosine phosphatase [Ruminococcus sp.]MBR1431533.1 hypothetical protein [Ruminococcus sp.]
MIDLHTHILPEMDDGSKAVEMSIEMLRMERDQGVDSVALTSHFYRDLEKPEAFFDKRNASFAKLKNAVESQNESLPKLYLGAEVAWVPGMCDWEELEGFCYEGTKFILIEPPFQHWTDLFFRELIGLHTRRGLTPVIAHIDRYYKSQKKDSIDRLLSMEYPIQISAAPFLDFLTKGNALKYIREGKAQLLISDCHNTSTRKPNIGPATEVLRKKFGSQINRLLNETDYIFE